MREKQMRNGLSNRPLRTGIIALGLLASVLSGCSWRNPILSYGPEPRVEDCAQIRQATPTQYVCNGKTYTSVQLQDIRNGTVASK
jgi:hypothetical protein